MLISIYFALICFFVPVIKTQCHYSCTTCHVDNDPNYCVDCGTNSVNHRSSSSGSCPCDFGYIDVGTNNCNLLNCHYSCVTCNGTAATCHSCNNAHQRVLVGNTCLCSTGYYDDGSNSQCATCHNSCYTCSGQSTTCTACSGANFRLLSTSTCVCITGYFE